MIYDKIYPNKVSSHIILCNGAKEGIPVADSSITKKALAGALKELMREQPFSKISVADICEKCNMNRKSFYYHFKDKYDLVNWIFDTEFIEVARNKPYESNEGNFLLDLCTYFDENKVFYSRALKVSGQNSFSEHFREMICAVLKEYLKTNRGNQNVLDFHINFFTDALMSAIERWIMDKDSVSPKEFVALLNSCLFWR